MVKQISLVATLFLFSAAAMADCSFEITGTDQMNWDVKEIDATGCDEVEITLKHGGNLPKATMGHGWVLTKTADQAGVAADGMAAGIDNNHVKPGDDRVIAMTDKLIGGGEETSVTFSTDKLEAGGDYTFFCPFPGHAAVMKGKFIF